MILPPPPCFYQRPSRLWFASPPRHLLHLNSICCILVNVRLAAKIRILDSHILHDYTLNTKLSESIYLGVLLLFR